MKSNVQAVLKAHCQSNPKISANSETKTFKNIAPKNKTSRDRTFMKEGRPEGFTSFSKKFRNPGDHRPKYFMAQQSFWKIFHGPSHQF